MFKLFADPKYLADPLVEINKTVDNITSDDYCTIPIFRWLVDNVGEINEIKENSWLSGNGWEVGYDYNADNTNWKRKHFIYIHIRRKDIDPKLLTEFALRFS